MDIDLNEIKTPCYVVDERLLIKNLKLLKYVQDETGCKILLAQKGFSMYSMYPLISKYLKGTAASSLFEARLGYEEMGGEVHIFSPAYIKEEFDEIMGISSHIVFNSFSQFKKYKDKISASKRDISCGIRVNPEYSEVKTQIYDPCGYGSRLGVTYKNFVNEDLIGISGLHFHTMCEQNSDTLKRTVDVFIDKFGKFLPDMKWVNLGGGHHITRADYDVATLIDCILSIKKQFGIDVYLEPGEAIALNTGFLVTSVLSVIENNIKIAIVDTSAACHMPDVLEMPYRPAVKGDCDDNPFKYRLGGPTCLAGDIIGDYSFKNPLKEGDKLVFCDMAHYTMVKNNTFNGINLPSIAAIDKDGRLNIIKSFGYRDFKSRL